MEYLSSVSNCSVGQLLLITDQVALLHSQSLLLQL